MKPTPQFTVLELICIIVGWEVGGIIGRYVVRQYRAAIIAEHEASRARKSAAEVAA